ncbi:uncharacterized protein LOC116652548 [Coturnix japonica]|uniref:uncharacterized protein LOC116652548 n=1 Tax=Coturnix japonica TaxID=93934 RepID=UPI0013A5E747|nr:uncharacterized protein LOC116652548 [Coturnix japonica]
MAAELDHRCTICLDSMDNASYVMPCLHQFCFGCIRRWAQTRPKCPLCNGRVTSILHSVRSDNNFEEYVVRQDGPRARRAPQSQPEAMPTWVSIFRQHPAVLRPLMPWVHQEVRQLFGADDRAAFSAFQLVFFGLSFYGLDEAALTVWLLSSPYRQAVSFVRQLVVRAVRLCSAEVQRLLGLEASHAPTGQEGRPAAVHGAATPSTGTVDDSLQPSRSTREANTEGELPGPSTSALREGPSQPPSNPAPVHRVQEAAQEEPGEAVPGPSSASTSRERSGRAPRRAPKRRRTHTAEDSAPPAKRPPRRRR